MPCCRRQGCAIEALFDCCKFRKLPPHANCVQDCYIHSSCIMLSTSCGSKGQAPGNLQHIYLHDCPSHNIPAVPAPALLTRQMLPTGEQSHSGRRACTTCKLGRPDVPLWTSRIDQCLQMAIGNRSESDCLSEWSVSRGSESQPAPAPAPVTIGATNSMVHAVDLAHQKAQTTPQLSFGQDGVTVQQPVVSATGFQQAHACIRMCGSGRQGSKGHAVRLAHPVAAAHTPAVCCA